MSSILKRASLTGARVTPCVFLTVSAMPSAQASLFAQSTPPPGVTIPPTAPERIEQTIPRPSELPRPLPPSPTPPILQTPVLQQLPNVALSGDRFILKTIKVQGNTVLQSEIAALVQRYQNREITFEDLLELRSQIVQLYINNSYVNSGAFIPNNQDLSSGIVQIQIVEGELEGIEIGELRRL